MIRERARIDSKTTPLLGSFPRIVSSARVVFQRAAPPLLRVSKRTGAPRAHCPDQQQLSVHASGQIILLSEEKETGFFNFLFFLLLLFFFKHSRDTESCLRKGF